MRKRALGNAAAAVERMADGGDLLTDGDWTEERDGQVRDELRRVAARLIRRNLDSVKP